MATGRLQCATPQISTTWYDLFSHFTNILILIIVFLSLSSQMLKSQVLGNISNNHYVYVGGLPSWYLAKLKVSHLIFRSPRIFLNVFVSFALIFKSRGCCRELYFYSINLLLTLDPHAPPMEAASFNRMKISCDLQYFSQDKVVRPRLGS